MSNKTTIFVYRANHFMCVWFSPQKNERPAKKVIRNIIKTMKNAILFPQNLAPHIGRQRSRKIGEREWVEKQRNDLWPNVWP